MGAAPHLSTVSHLWHPLRGDERCDLDPAETCRRTGELSPSPAPMKCGADSAPQRESRSTSCAFSAAGISRFSFCSPSRGPTSKISTDRLVLPPPPLPLLLLRAGVASKSARPRRPASSNVREGKAQQKNIGPNSSCKLGQGSSELALPAGRASRLAGTMSSVPRLWRSTASVPVVPAVPPARVKRDMRAGFHFSAKTGM